MPKVLLRKKEISKLEDTKRRNEELKMKNEEFDTARQYADIINLPHHVSQKHPQMSMHQRAAQFAPFAALSDHSVTDENE